MSEENRLELAMTVHFTVPHGMAREDAHRLMVERFTCWLSDPDNDLRRTWGLFSPATVP